MGSTIFGGVDISSCSGLDSVEHVGPSTLGIDSIIRSKGFDEKQLVPGDDISRGLERAIGSWDKFLLCASKNSLTSPWVEEEIETTLEKERTLRKERRDRGLQTHSNRP